jgi:predicted transglutaminase-like cysteine proteinase
MGLVLAAFTASGCQTAGHRFTLFQWSPPQSSPMAANAFQAMPPSGFIDFCIRNPVQCVAPAGQPEVVQLDQRNWETLEFVNERVNRTIRVLDDFVHYGRADYWTIAQDGTGDCEDFALTKRKELIDAGLPERALRIAVVRTWSNEGHAVLTVATDHGDYVLDNLTMQILPWREARYTWISRQDAENPLLWVSLLPAPMVGLATPAPQPDATATGE